MSSSDATLDAAAGAAGGTRRDRRWFSVAFVAVVIVLGGIELGIRQWMGSTFEGRFDYGYAAGTSIARHGDTIEILHTGGRKFWPQSIAARKPAGMRRIVTVGDSISRGGTLEESWPWQIGERLRAAGIANESVNLSLPGYGSHRKLLLVEDALKLEPDLLIMQVGTSNEFEDERDYARAMDFAGPHPRNWPMKSLLVRRIYEFKHENLFVKWLPADVRARTAVNDAADETLANRDPARVRAWHERFLRYTGAALALAHDKGVPVLVVPRTVLRRTATPPAFDDEQVHTLLAPLLNAHDRWFDPATAFDPVADDAVFFRDGVHFHAEGHARMADALARQVAPMLAASR